MLCFVVWDICFLLLLSGNSEEIGWIVSLHGGFDEGSGDMVSLTFLKRWHGDLGFRMTTLRWRWCRRHGINFAGHFSVLSRLDPTTCWKTCENKFASPPPSWFRSVLDCIDWDQERGRRKTKKGRRSCSFQRTGMLVAVLWALILSLLAEHICVRPSIWFLHIFRIEIRSCAWILCEWCL
jgi:hypothetical protein